MSYVPPSHIAIVNKTTLVDNREVELWINAYAEEVKPLCEAWGLAPPGLALYPSAHNEEPDPAVAVIYIVDSAGDPEALGYHSVLGRSRFAYVDAVLSAMWSSPSIVFGHELHELIVNADLERWHEYADGSAIPDEACDACQDQYYAARATLFGASATVLVADWVHIAWFIPGAVGPYDHLGRIFRPLENTAGGYHLVERNGVITSVGQARLKNFGRTFRLLGRRRK